MTKEKKKGDVSALSGQRARCLMVPGATAVCGAPPVGGGGQTRMQDQYAESLLDCPTRCELSFFLSFFFPPGHLHAPITFHTHIKSNSSGVAPLGNVSQAGEDYKL